jgi:hypothetical protein
MEAALTEFRKIPEFVEIEDFINKMVATDISDSEKDALVKTMIDDSHYCKILQNPALAKMNLADTGIFPSEFKSEANG